MGRRSLHDGLREMACIVLVADWFTDGEAVLKASLIVHGGAWDIPPDLIEPHESGCKAALLEGREILRSGGHALDAVERATKELEDDPVVGI